MRNFIAVVLIIIGLILFFGGIIGCIAGSIGGWKALVSMVAGCILAIAGSKLYEKDTWSSGGSSGGFPRGFSSGSPSGGSSSSPIRSR